MQRNKPTVDVIDDLPSDTANLQSPDLSAGVTTITKNMVTIKGRVVEMTSEGADEHLHKLAKRYLGIGKYYYRKPKDKRVIIKVKPDKMMK